MTRHFAGCTGKKSFERFNQAENAARRRNRHDGDAHLEAYHCRHCNRFHIGENRSYKVKDKRKEVA